MEIGVGLPNAIPDVDRDSLLEFARRADARGFASLGTVDRLVYPSFEPLVSLAAVGRGDRAHQARRPPCCWAPCGRTRACSPRRCLTLDHVSDGRFWLGIGLGARDDDYEASGIPMRAGGATLNRQLEQIEAAGRGTTVGPKPLPAGRPPELLVGGHAPTPRSSELRGSATAGSWAAARRTSSPQLRAEGGRRPGSGPAATEALEGLARLLLARSGCPGDMPSGTSATTTSGSATIAAQIVAVSRPRRRRSRATSRPSSRRAATS